MLVTHTPTLLDCLTQFFGIVKNPFYDLEKVDVMSLNREIEALKKRLAKVVPIASPPKLSMNVIQQGSGVEPIDSPWVLNLLVENRPIQEDI